MAREELLVETFVTLADTLVDDYDVIDFLQTLAERCVELLDVSQAGIMLADPTGALHHAACSNENMRLVELFEIQVGQGPCFDAFHEQGAVRCDTPEEAATRWPEFATYAHEHGFLAISAVPLRLRAQVVGALNLFSATSGALSDADLMVAQAMADVATIGILQERAVGDARTTSSQLQHALDSRILIEQAKGVVAEHRQVSVDEAFGMIRAFTRSHNRLLHTTARQIIDGSLRVEELESSPGSRSSPTP